MSERDVWVSLYLYRYAGWSTERIARFYDVRPGDIGRAWGTTGVRARPYNKAVADLARRISSGHVRHPSVPA